MKFSGVIFILFGLGAIGGGIAFFVGIARRVSEAKLVGTIPLQAEKPTSTDLFPVSTARKCQLTAELNPDLKAFGEADFREIRNDYPVWISYRILDEGGTVLVAEALRTSDFSITQNSWTGHVEYGYSSSKFAAPASGRVRVEATMTSKGKTRRFTRTELKLYDTVSDHTQAGVYGTALSLAGGVVVLLGGGLLAAGILNRRTMTPGPIARTEKA